MRVMKASKEQDLENQRRDYRDHNLTTLDNLHSTLFAALDAVEESKIPYALIGGLAVKRLGRPRVTHDIDFFVRPDDADKLLEFMKEKGFEVYVRDPFWLYKAWRDDVLVDIIFKSSGDIYFDEEMRENVRRVNYHGRAMNAISPEDFIVIKAAAHEEHNPHHWHDALAVLTQGSIDWEYLLKRAKHAPRRVLALLIYAQSNDVAVPSEVIQKLYRYLYEPPVHIQHQHVHPYRETFTAEAPPKTKECSPVYMKGKVMDALTQDERIAEHDIHVKISDHSIIVRGEVFTEAQKDAVDEVIESVAPELDIQNFVRVRKLTMPEGSEVIR